jgi:hypothetical protein
MALFVYPTKSNRLVGKTKTNLPLFISKEIVEKYDIYDNHTILTNAKRTALLSVRKFDERLRDINVRL